MKKKMTPEERAEAEARISQLRELAERKRVEIEVLREAEEARRARQEARRQRLRRLFFRST